MVVMAMFLNVNALHASDLRPITARDLATIRDIGGHNYGAMSVSPDGYYVAFQLQTPVIQEGDYELTWYVAETTVSGEVWPIGEGGELILNPSLSSMTSGNRPPVSPIWSPNGEWIIYLKRVDGDTQIWRSSRDGKIQEQLTNNRGEVLSSSYNESAPPSFEFIEARNTILFSVVEDAAIIHQRLMEEGDRGFLFDDRFRPAKDTAPFMRTCGYRSRGRPKEVKIERACNPQLWAYDIDRGKERPATQDEITVYYSSPNLPSALAGRDVHLFRESKDRNSQIWLENENPEAFPGSKASVRLFAFVGGKEYRCGAKVCRAYSGVIEGVWFRPESREIVFQRADGSNESTTGLYAWTPDTDEVRSILLTDDKLSDCEIFEDRAICLREQWTHPRTIIAVDLESGGIVTIYDPNPEFNDIKFGKIEKIEWKDQFGCASHGHLVYPLNYEVGHRYPLVITTYRSRGFLRGATGDEYPIHLFAANGVMVLSHDKPRCPERFALMEEWYKAEWEELHERNSTLSAQKHILEILDDRGLIDMQRTAITGLSDGVDQVKFALIHTDLFATAIASGLNSYRTLYYLSNKNWRYYWRARLGGPPDTDRLGYWRALSLAQNVDKFDIPLLVNVSDAEFLFSVETISRLQEAGKMVEAYVFPDEYHIKWQPQHRYAIYQRNVQWLKFWLLSVEEGDPVSHGQYARWRKMRDERCAWNEPEDEKPSYCEFATVSARSSRADAPGSARSSH